MPPVFQFERFSYGPAYKEKNRNYITFIWILLNYRKLRFWLGKQTDFLSNKITLMIKILTI